MKLPQPLFDSPSREGNANAKKKHPPQRQPIGVEGALSA